MFRRGNLAVLCVAVLCTTIGGTLAFAQGVVEVVPPGEGNIQDRVEALEKKMDAPSMWKALGLKMSGFVDVAYTQNFNNPSTNLNQLHIFDTNASSFMAHLAQIVLERPAEAGGSMMDRAGFRARLNFGLDARVTRARTNYQPGVASDEFDFQELYGEYILPIGNGLRVQAGKINTLIGYEVINSWENVNFSRSFMFGLGQAFTTTGLRLTYTFNPLITASVGVTNGWDNVDDNNKGKTVEWLVALTPAERVGVNFYGSVGPEQSNTVGGIATGDASAIRTAVGSIITFKATNQDLLVLEPYYANEANANLVAGKAGKNARWNGLAGYLVHDVNDQWSFRMRGEIFEDAGGARTCTGSIAGTLGPFTGVPGGWNTCAGAPGGVGTGGIAQTLWETTYTLQYKPIPSLITRLEFRYDKSNKNVFLNGNDPTNNQETMSFELVYLF